MRLALLGNPVGHSRSPDIFAAAFAATGIDGTYEARSVDDDGVRSAFAEVASGDLSGINVTMPHKVLAFSLCDQVDEEAARAGSVNTVAKRDGQLVGYSTDIDGIRACFEVLPRDRPVLILGSGGAAAAAVVAMTDVQIYLSARRSGTASELSSRTGVEVGELRWGVPVVGATVINCTPLGMKGESLPAPVLELAGALFDMAYKRGQTPAVTYMKERGSPVVEGLELLVSQAGFGFRLLTGVEPPLEAMRRAAENP